MPTSVLPTRIVSWKSCSTWTFWQIAQTLLPVWPIKSYSCESCFFPDTVLRVLAAAIAFGSMCGCSRARATRSKFSHCWTTDIWESYTKQDVGDGGGLPRGMVGACAMLSACAVLMRSFANKKYVHFCRLLSNFSSSARARDSLWITTTLPTLITP